MMEKTGLVILLSLVISGGISAPAIGNEGFSTGARFMAGGRYDNLRMCVATDAGVKGGPMADIQLALKYTVSREYSVTFNLPVMRPVLFWTAFDMLQFEPEFTFDYRKPLGGKISFTTGPGLGVSLHYGPDYRSDLDNRGDDFFAAGPYISYMCGLVFESGSTLGLRAIYVPLFSEEHSTGTVLGAALEYTVFF
jgi:hypothetical protein